MMAHTARIVDHPILGPLGRKKEVTITVDGKKIEAFEGEMVATALVAAGYKAFRYTSKGREPRGIFCAIGRCTDCVMEVNGRPNVRTCVTPVEEGMAVNTQEGLGKWREDASGGNGGDR
jgi:predicted molibdopterin-dependent oxidoreductase YjgC